MSSGQLRLLPGLKVWLRNPYPNTDPSYRAQWHSSDISGRPFWVPAEIISLGSGPQIEINVSTTIHPRVVVVASVDDILPMSASITSNDLSDLQYIHEADVLHNVMIRAWENKFVTQAGPVTLSLNPCVNPLDRDGISIYDPFHMVRYHSKPSERIIESIPLEKRSFMKLDSHLYEEAERLYTNLCTDRMSQSLVLAGESGSGKSETFKLILQYLLAIPAMESEGAVPGALIQTIAPSSVGGRLSSFPPPTNPLLIPTASTLEAAQEDSRRRSGPLGTSTNPWLFRTSYIPRLQSIALPGISPSFDFESDESLFQSPSHSSTMFTSSSVAALEKLVNAIDVPLTRVLLSGLTVLEAFGCAATPNNSHASKHIRSVELEFLPRNSSSTENMSQLNSEFPIDNTSLTPISAHVEAFLTDTHRVLGASFEPRHYCTANGSQTGNANLTVPPSGRNYHIFYQLLAGCSDMERSQLRLGTVGDYLSLLTRTTPLNQFHLNSKSPDSLDSSIDQVPSYIPHTSQRSDLMVFGAPLPSPSDLSVTRAALHDIGLSDAEIFQIFRIISGLLIAGNIRFAPSEGTGTVGSSSETIVATEQEFRLFCDSLGLEPQRVQTALLSDRRSSEVRVALDTFVVGLYESLFSYLVYRLNVRLREVRLDNLRTFYSSHSLNTDQKDPLSILLVDPPGYLTPAGPALFSTTPSPEWINGDPRYALQRMEQSARRTPAGLVADAAKGGLQGLDVLLQNVLSEHFQSLFVATVFKGEAALYQAEGLPASLSSSIGSSAVSSASSHSLGAVGDSEEILKVVSLPSTGILAMIDDLGGMQRGGASDSVLGMNLNAALRSSNAIMKPPVVTDMQHVLSVQPQEGAQYSVRSVLLPPALQGADTNTLFGLQHSFGPVMYSACGFLAQAQLSSDRVCSGLVEAVSLSSLHILKSLSSSTPLPLHHASHSHNHNNINNNNNNNKKEALLDVASLLDSSTDEFGLDVLESLARRQQKQSLLREQQDQANKRAVDEDSHFPALTFSRISSSALSISKNSVSIDDYGMGAVASLYPSQLLRRLEALLAPLNRPDLLPSFLRCLSPNCGLRRFYLSPSVLRAQLDAVKVVAALSLSDSGFPVRQYYSDFYARYLVLGRGLAVAVANRGGGLSAASVLRQFKFVAPTLAAYFHLPLASSSTSAPSLKELEDVDQYLRGGLPFPPPAQIPLPVLCAALLAIIMTHPAFALVQTAPKHAQMNSIGGVSAGNMQIWQAAAFGESKLFLRKAVADALESLRSARLRSMDTAATAMQALWRGYYLRRRLEVVRRGVARAQAAVAALTARRGLLVARRAATVIQARVRARKARRAYLAAREIAAWARRVRQRRQWVRTRAGIAHAHALARGLLARAHTVKLLQAVERLQAFARSVIARARIRRFADAAAAAFQAVWRGHVLRLENEHLLVQLAAARRQRALTRAAELLRALISGWRVRRVLAHLRTCATVLQRFFRASRQRAAFLRAVYSAVIIQKWVRGHIARVCIFRIRTLRSTADHLHRVALLRKQEIASLAKADASDIISLFPPASRILLASSTGIAVPNVVDSSSSSNNAVNSNGISKNALFQYSRIVEVDIGDDISAYFKQGLARSLHQLEQRLRGRGTRIAAVGVGASHAAAASEHGQLFVWGFGDRGQCGNGRFSGEAQPLALDDNLSKKALETAAEAVQTSLTRFIASRAPGGPRPRFLDPLPTFPASLGPVRVRTIACGAEHTLVLTESGRALGWGSSRRGQLGTGAAQAVLVPTPLRLLGRSSDGPALEAADAARVKEIAAGAFHSLLLSSTGVVFSAGAKEFNGHPSSTNPSETSNHNNNIVFDNNSNSKDAEHDSDCLVFLPLAGLLHADTRIRKIAAAPSFSAAVSTTGDVYTWGAGTFGQLGLGESLYSLQALLPTPEPLRSEVRPASSATLKSQHSSLSEYSDVPVQPSRPRQGVLSPSMNQEMNGAESVSELRRVMSTDDSTPARFAPFLASPAPSSPPTSSNASPELFHTLLDRQLLDSSVSPGEDLDFKFSESTNSSSSSVAASNNYNNSNNNNNNSKNKIELVAGPFVDIRVPTLVPLAHSSTQTPADTRIVSISLGLHHAVALTSTGKLFTWGSNLSGALGVGVVGPIPFELLRRHGARAPSVPCILQRRVRVGAGAGVPVVQPRPYSADPLLIELDQVGDSHVVSVLCNAHSTICVTDSHRALGFGRFGRAWTGVDAGVLLAKAVAMQPMEDPRGRPTSAGPVYTPSPELLWLARQPAFMEESSRGSPVVCVQPAAVSLDSLFPSILAVPAAVPRFFGGFSGSASVLLAQCATAPASESELRTMAEMTAGSFFPQPLASMGEFERPVLPLPPVAAVTPSASYLVSTLFTELDVAADEVSGVSADSTTKLSQPFAPSAHLQALRSGMGHALSSSSVRRLGSWISATAPNELGQRGVGGVGNARAPSTIIDTLVGGVTLNESILTPSKQSPSKQSPLKQFPSKEETSKLLTPTSKDISSESHRLKNLQRSLLRGVAGMALATPPSKNTTTNIDKSNLGGGIPNTTVSTASHVPTARVNSTRNLLQLDSSLDRAHSGIVARTPVFSSTLAAHLRHVRAVLTPDTLLLADSIASDPTAAAAMLLIAPERLFSLPPSAAVVIVDRLLQQAGAARVRQRLGWIPPTLHSSCGAHISAAARLHLLLKNPSKFHLRLFSNSYFSGNSSGDIIKKNDRIGNWEDGPFDKLAYRLAVYWPSPFGQFNNLFIVKPPTVPKPKGFHNATVTGLNKLSGVDNHPAKISVQVAEVSGVDANITGSATTINTATMNIGQKEPAISQTQLASTLRSGLNRIKTLSQTIADDSSRDLEDPFTGLRLSKSTDAPPAPVIEPLADSSHAPPFDSVPSGPPSPVNVPSILKSSSSVKESSSLVKGVSGEIDLANEAMAKQVSDTQKQLEAIRLRSAAVVALQLQEHEAHLLSLSDTLSTVKHSQNERVAQIASGALASFQMTESLASVPNSSSNPTSAPVPEPNPYSFTQNYDDAEFRTPMKSATQQVSQEFQNCDNLHDVSKYMLSAEMQARFMSLPAEERLELLDTLRSQLRGD